MTFSVTIDVNKLQEWIVRHLQQKDLLKKTIVEIIDDPEKNSNVVVKTTSGEQHIMITPQLVVPIPVQTPLIIVTENTEENVQLLIKEWDSFSTRENVWVYFVSLASNRYWVIHPFVHNKITEKASLALGIKSMYAASLQ